MGLRLLSWSFPSFRPPFTGCMPDRLLETLCTLRLMSLTFLLGVNEVSSRSYPPIELIRCRVGSVCVLGHW